MKSPVPRGKDGIALGVGDIVDVCWLDGNIIRATILSLEEVLDESEIKMFDSVVGSQVNRNVSYGDPVKLGDISMKLDTSEVNPN